MVPAISGRVEQLAEMHNTLWQIFEPGDSLVYSGNYLGNPRQNALGADAIQDIRMFTRALVTEGRADRNQIVMLRGINEELIQKALQIQFANKPEDVLIWMGQKGLGPLLEHYGTSLHAGLSACRGGTMSLTRWTCDLREAIRQTAEHEFTYNRLQRAAVTHDEYGNAQSLFVHAGLDDRRPLHAQKDAFWWGAHSFDQMQQHYNPFKCVVRGHDPLARGPSYTDYKVSVDETFEGNSPLALSNLTSLGQINAIYHF